MPRLRTTEWGEGRLARAGKSRGASDMMGEAPTASVIFAEKFLTT